MKKNTIAEFGKLRGKGRHTRHKRKPGVKKQRRGTGEKRVSKKGTEKLLGMNTGTGHGKIGKQGGDKRAGRVS